MSTPTSSNPLPGSVDVLVVGGGAAGLSAAVALARARRDVLVVDAGRPRNAPAAGVHNLLTRDGLAPDELQRLGAAEVHRFGGRVASGTATTARRVEGGFVVGTTAGEVRARRLVVTTGLVDDLPALPGLREQWGRGVVHCPYCHGYEVSDQALGVLNLGPLSTHQALLFTQWTRDLVLFTHTGPEVTEPRRTELLARGVRFVDGEVAEVLSTGGTLTGVRLADGSTVARAALVVGAGVTASSPVLDGLGLAAAPVVVLGVEVGSLYPSGPGGATAVPGVHLAGNVTDAQAQVVSSAAAGLAVGAAVNADLLGEDVAADVAAFRAAG